ncbi:CaiB/BaiF CoA transferase family protein [Noviherbaspirillum denitrificans]|uniref:Acyl-CoA hydratase n=1 Tax=Noviherbaspirillum denitrificans TaxID=1968433 RepID=A0A254TKP9_9BURK|nr:CaiB/BaiF CoA-transferase family protein [Noviherbaspirillum denitrificans]OWW22787.1 acyl-CoA hydratase [Noviherbaspirillum denitrificans]
MRTTERKQGMQALQGIRILDLTRLLPGATCTMLLADLGAEVLKVEQPGEGDYNRSFEPINKKESGSFLLLNRNKRSITLNLKHEEGKEVFRRLVKEYDVVVEGFRPGVMDRLGFGYEELKKLNPRIVACSISGFGQNGPLRMASGHDLNYMALSGALQLFGTKETGPIVPGLSIADVGGGSLMAVYGILAALIARDRLGSGQYIDVSMFDGIVTWLALHGADYLFAGIEPKGGERPFIGAAPCYNVYKCGDGGALSLGIIEEHFWERLCDEIGEPDWKARQWATGEDARVQFEKLSALFRSAPRDEWVRRLEAIDVPVAPVNSVQEAFAHPQAVARGLLYECEHPVEGKIPQLGFPVKLSGTPAAHRLPPPLLGQHTEEVLGSLGYSESDIRTLREREAI